jgi:hypothetical protein
MAVALMVSACALTIGGGQRTTETRPAEPFTKIRVGAGIGVALTIGPASPIVISAQSDIVSRVTTTLEGDTLVIDIEGAIITEAITVTLATPTLESIELSGGAHLDLGAIQTASLAISLSGGSRIALTAPGTVGALDLEVSGGARADLADLSVEAANVDLSGGANATINASDAVNGSVSGGAHLTVKGDATLDVESSGGGSVSKG